jgi:hypothetical protein
MKSILWKEFRENLKWGVLLLLAATFGIIALQVFEPHKIVLFNEEYMVQAAFGFAAGALALGILQTVFEGSRDRWAFLMHRGVSPERILAAKAIAGLTYILVAAGIPLLGMTWWCSRPGNVPAPFHSIAPLVGVIGIFAAFPAWFAGVLIGLRDVRWYGSRILPLGLALAPIISVLVATQYWHVSKMVQTIPMSLLATAIYAAAAVGVVKHRGGYLSQSRPSRWCLALTTAFGSLILLLCVFTMTIEGLREVDVDLLQNTRSIHYAITDEGNVVRVETDASSRPRGPRLVDPASGELVNVSLAGPWDPFFGRSNVGLEISKKHAPRQELGQYAERAILLRSIRVGDSLWYYLPLEGVVEGYSTDPGPRRIQRFGPNGDFEDGEVVTRRFKGRASEPLTSLMRNYQVHSALPNGVGHAVPNFVNWVNFLGFEDGIYSIVPGSPGVYQVYHAPEENPLLEFAPCDSESAVWLLHQKTARKVVLSEAVDGKATELPSDADGRLSFHEDLPGYEIRYPEALPESGVKMFDLPEVKQVAYRWNLRWDHRNGTRHQCVVIATRGGEIVKQIVHDGPTFAKIDSYFAPIYPLGFMETYLRLFPEPARGVPVAGVPTDYFVTPPTYAYEIVMCLSTLFTAMVTVLIAKRASQSNASIVRWVLGVVIFGPAGLVTLLMLRERPRCQLCAVCSQRRPISAAVCPHCSKPFPKPDTDGTEILLPMNSGTELASADVVPAAGI